MKLRYWWNGWILATSEPLSRVAEAEASSYDIELQWKPANKGEFSDSLRREEDVCDLYIHRIAHYRLHLDEGVIEIHPDAAAIPEQVEHGLLRTALAFLASFRGCVCLHAACVAEEGRGVLYVGPSGSGKSTAAFMHVNRGALLVSDDVVILSPHGNHWSLRLSEQWLRLEKHAVDYLDIPSMEYRESGQKRAYRLPCIEPLEPVVLTRLHVPKSASSLEVPDNGRQERWQDASVDPTRALMLLCSQTFAWRWLSPSERAQVFSRLASIASACGVPWLTGPPPSRRVSGEFDC